LWEYNHVIIVNAIDSLTKNYNRFPSRREISTETGLSHQTINKHLKEYFNSNYFQDKKDEYLLLRESLLSKIYKFATEGNIKAARIFIDATTLMQPGICVKNQQNNFININGFNITQEQFKQLPEEQQTVLYEIIKMIPQALSKRVVSQFEF
jgi:predicted transcriptional regulator